MIYCKQIKGLLMLANVFLDQLLDLQFCQEKCKCYWLYAQEISY